MSFLYRVRAYLREVVIYVKCMRSWFKFARGDSWTLRVNRRHSVSLFCGVAGEKSNLSFPLPSSDQSFSFGGILNFRFEEETLRVRTFISLTCNMLTWLFYYYYYYYLYLYITYLWFIYYCNMMMSGRWRWVRVRPAQANIGRRWV